MENTSYGQALRFVLFIGAAIDDATDEQINQIYEKLPSLLKRYQLTGREDAIRNTIHDAMGQQWEPSGEWKKQIDGLRKSQFR